MMMQKCTISSIKNEQTKIKICNNVNIFIFVQMIYSGSMNTEFEQLTGFEDYEIKLIDGMAVIRRIQDKFEPKYTFDKSSGYYRITLNGKLYRLHRIIANHYINHDDKHDVCDHMDRNKINYNIMNLRWTTITENNKNRSISTSNTDIVYEYIDDIPDNSVSILRYGKHFFKDYYYANNTFYYYNQHQFRILPKLIDRNGYEYVYAYDTNNKQVQIYIRKWDKIKGW